jgi:hypothetical protein
MAQDLHAVVQIGVVFPSYFEVGAREALRRGAIRRD